MATTLSLQQDRTAESDNARRDWLLQNRNERMDANIDAFPAERRDFHLDRYRFAARFCKGRRVLDGACGTGYGSAILGETASEVIGIDCSEEAVIYADEVYREKHIQFDKQRVEFTPYKAGSFDVVTSFETVEHTLCPQAHIHEIRRLLNPVTGIAVMSIPNQWGFTPYHFFDFDYKLLQTLLAPCFGQTDWFYQNSGTRKGKDHLRGIGPLEDIDPREAECILAVCRNPKEDTLGSNRLDRVLSETYDSAFARHRSYLALARRERKRPMNRLARFVGHIFGKQ